MRCFIVVVLSVACAGAVGAAATGCALSREFLVRHNASADDSDVPGPICGGQCCGRGREETLRNALRRTAEDRAAASLRPIAELLLSTQRTLQEHLIALSYQSQNKTAGLLAQVYRGNAARTHAPLASLYDDIRLVLRLEPERDSNEDISTSKASPKNLGISSDNFFMEVFPIAYQNVLRLDTRKFEPAFDACLLDAYNTVRPFGEIPIELGISLTKSLDATRALLQVLTVGAAALASAERVLTNADEVCSNKLLAVGGCSHCRGHPARPCRNYCLNVARGCIGSMVAELDAPWAGYVEGVERLARADADAALRGVDAHVSEAIMHALENHAILEKKVRQECGPPVLEEAPELSTPRPTPGASRREALRAPPPDTEMLQFAASLASSKKLFATLADKLCDEPDFAQEDNDVCWNGEIVAEYIKPLVASASLSDQRYNPEVTGGAPQDSRVAALGDRLRQARQSLILNKWETQPLAEAFMQGDEAGDEGSGSGVRSYPDDDASYDAEGSGEEGSGSQDMGSKSFAGEEPTYTSTPRTGAAASTRPLLLVILTMTLAGLGGCLT